MVVCKHKPGHNCLCIRDELVGLFPRSTGTEPEVVLVAADLSQ
jgi:hypothetical protein